MELVAHRAGNATSTLRAALAVTDVVELDVHQFRGRLEVRHAKVLWPFSTRWERWEILPAADPRPTLEGILDVVPAGAHLWLDLKGGTPALTRRALRAVDGRFPLTVSSRCWWILAPARRIPQVRTMRSAGNRLQVWMVQRLGSARRGDGVVMPERLASPSSIERVRRVSSAVFVWAVTDLGRAIELAGIGVDGLIIDDLELLAATRRRTP